MLCVVVQCEVRDMHQGSVWLKILLQWMLGTSELLWAWAMSGIRRMRMLQRLDGGELLDLRQEPVWGVVV